MPTRITFRKYLNKHRFHESTTGLLARQVLDAKEWKGSSADSLEKYIEGRSDYFILKVALDLAISEFNAEVNPDNIVKEGD